jgi:hypothetical protein
MSRLALVLGLTVAAAGCSASGERAGDSADAQPETPASTVDESLTLALGDLIEGTWEAGPDDRIVVTIDGAGEFGWSIHGHAGSDTTTIVEAEHQSHVSHDFSPPDQATWYLLIANQSTDLNDVAVHMDLYRDASWSGWGP